MKKKYLKSKKTVCFFAGVKERRLLELIEWYKIDIEILKRLGFDVKIATNWKEISWNADLYFVWWPTKGIVPILISKLLKKPAILVAGGSEIVNSIKLKYDFNTSNPLKKLSIISSLRFSDKILCISKFSMKEIFSIPLAGKKIGEKTETVYLCVDTQKYDYCYNRENNKNIILTISRLDEDHIYRKCIFSIISSAKILSKKNYNLKFVILGEKGRGFGEVEKKVKELGLKETVKFTGMVPEDVKLRYFQRSLIYLQPTLHEGFGLAIAEAMSCGIPIVTSNRGSVPEVVGDAGIYIDPNNPKEIAEAIETLVLDFNLRKRLSKMGRQRVLNNFTVRHREKKIGKIIQEVLHEH